MADCLRRLEERQHRAQGQATAALLAAKEEELGASALAEAAVSDIEPEDETVKEGVSVLRTGQEIGLRIHDKERKGEDGEPACR